MNLGNDSKSLDKSVEAAVHVLSSMTGQDKHSMFNEEENRDSYDLNTCGILKNEKLQASYSSHSMPKLKLLNPTAWSVARSNAIESFPQVCHVEHEALDELHNLIDLTQLVQTKPQNGRQKSKKVQYVSSHVDHDSTEIFENACFENCRTSRSSGKDNSDNLPGVGNSCPSLSPPKNVYWESSRTIGDKNLCSPKGCAKNRDMEEEDWTELYDLIDVTPIKIISKKEVRRKKRRKNCAKALNFEDAASRNRELSTKRGRQTRHPDRYKPIEKIAVSISRFTEITSASSSEESSCDDSSFDG